jgi:hypothetical protein
MNIQKNELIIHSKLVNMLQIVATKIKWTLHCSLHVEKTKVFEFQKIVNKLVNS